MRAMVDFPEDTNVRHIDSSGLGFCESSDVPASLSTVQPFGIPSSPLTSHMASLLLTNVPVDDTPESQPLVVSSEGSSVNKALT